MAGLEVKVRTEAWAGLAVWAAMEVMEAMALLVIALAPAVAVTATMEVAVGRAAAGEMAHMEEMAV